ncbi:hypothetical protein [Phenylobacterium sp.]|uniref:hypothetical protein n=1 Tax=Phenylobacterium sp. TaxID=1871053 RepID=UPI00395A11D3
MLRPAALIALAVLAATPAAAQSFLKDLAKSAARQATEAAVRNVMTPQSNGGRASQAGQAPAKRSAGKAGRPSMGDIERPADLAEKKKALDDFSAYPCDDCEGGRGYDSWARHGLNMVGGSDFEKKVGAMGVGESLTWKGRAADGALTVVADAEHEGFQCKEVVYRMTKVKTKATAEREGLFCQNAAGGWAEVY